MDRQTFNDLFRDLIPHLYDYTVVEAHPLTIALTLPEDHRGSRGEYIRKLVAEAIEKFKPVTRTLNLTAPESRPYLILHGRYIQGLSPQELAGKLALSERQLRRDHSRALQALADHLYDQLFPGQLGSQEPFEGQENAALRGFEIHPEPLDLYLVIQGVLTTLKSRADAEGIHLKLSLSEIANPVLTDRIVLRQVLLSLFNNVFRMPTNRVIEISTTFDDTQAHIHIRAAIEDTWADWNSSEHQDLLDTARHWGKKTNINIQQTYPQPGQAGLLHFHVSMPSSASPIVIVVDDQQPTLRMYQRYLSRSNLKILGVSDPTQVLPLAHQMQPILILLDVMMPYVDGWEILQALRADAKTQNIPVIVCSAWEASELALSLGAADFLKKPITQKELLTALEKLELLKIG
ncbi:MAG: response regulator [Chloroflexota bacterium]